MNSQPHTLLVVDDNEMNRDALCRRLVRKGYRALGAADGYEALGVVEEEEIDLVLLDIMMPGISGLELLQMLRKSRSPVDLPIIMVTARDQKTDMIEALGQGANDYVAKPIDFPVLLARVEAQLRMRSAPLPGAGPKDTTRGPLLTRLEPGAVLRERYLLEAEIGRGSHGIVFRAKHLGLDSPLAVKILNVPGGTTAEEVAVFQREGITTCRVQHPNVVSIYDFDVTPEGVAFLAMELLEGHSLQQEIAQSGRLAPRRCVEILLPICEALATAHEQSIVHRDVKPANIFLHRGRYGEVVKVLDFGIAKFVGARQPTDWRNTTVLGTPTYLPPERFRKAPYDGRSDIYSLGVTLYVMLSGRPPFQAPQGDWLKTALMHVDEQPPPLREVCPGAPRAIEEAVMQTLSKDPRQRPDARGLAQALARAAGLPIPEQLSGSAALPSGR